MIEVAEQVPGLVGIRGDCSGVTQHVKRFKVTPAFGEGGTEGNQAFGRIRFEFDRMASHGNSLGQIWASVLGKIGGFH